jgi:AraC-like DNA-binding protein
MDPNFKAELKDFNSGIEDIFISKLDDDFFAVFPWFADFHQSHFNTILMVEDGTGNLVTIQNTKQILDSNCLIIPKNYLNKIVFEKGLKGLFIAFNDCFFSNRYNNNMLNQFAIFSKGIAPTILNRSQIQNSAYLEKRILEEFSLSKPYQDKILRSYLNILLIEIERITGESNSHLGKFDSKDEKLMKFYELIQTSSNSRKKTYQYAEEMGVSIGYLSKIVKEKTGNTPAEIIRIELINQAKALLTTTNLSIKEIAFELGFENFSYFNTFFKSMENSTPEKYRQKHD